MLLPGPRHRLLRQGRPRQRVDLVSHKETAQRNHQQTTEHHGDNKETTPEATIPPGSPGFMNKVTGLPPSTGKSGEQNAFHQTLEGFRSSWMCSIIFWDPRWHDKYVGICVCTCVEYVHPCIHACMHARTHTHIYTHARMHTHIHTYILTYFITLHCIALHYIHPSMHYITLNYIS